jgi:hypothetical protein
MATAVSTASTFLIMGNLLFQALEEAWLAAGEVTIRTAARTVGTGPGGVPRSDRRG